MGKKNKKSWKMRNFLQDLLLLSINKDNRIISLILDNIETLDDNVLDEFANHMCKMEYTPLDQSLALGEKGNLLIIDKLIDYQPDNINKYFEIALNNGNIMTAVMISNYDMSNYINDNRIIDFLEKYINDEN